MMIAVLCGGQSVEHSISILSARNIVTALRAAGNQVCVIYLTREAAWWRLRNPDVLAEPDFENKALATLGDRLCLVPGSGRASFALAQNPAERLTVDCVFPVLHGPCGEDGTVQGLLKLLELPFVGSEFLGCGLCMDKHRAKQLLRHAGLPTLDWVFVRKRYRHLHSYQKLTQELGVSVFFVKSIHLGSSIGVYRVDSSDSFLSALEACFAVDDAVIVEVALEKPREIECALLHDGSEFRGAVLGEVTTTNTFYDYEAKYIDAEASRLIVPAPIAPEVAVRCQRLAEQAFEILGCDGLVRVDFLIDADGHIFVSELNAIPGMTNISLYPKIDQGLGVSFPQVLQLLLHEAMQRFHLACRHKVDREPALSGEI